MFNTGINRGLTEGYEKLAEEIVRAVRTVCEDA